ncbi:MAG: ferric reductase-like transmembrane domain-containing protein [Candidatus Nanopelagicales bacterium]
MTWELIRITGLVSLALLTVSVALGIAGPAIRRPTGRLTSVSVHLTAAVGGTVLVIAHVVFAVLDSWVSVPLSAAFLPGTSQWEPLWIGVGTVAFDLMLVIAATSALRQQAPRLWWRAHVIAYPVWLLVWLHALTIGTDRGTTLMTAMAALSAAIVAAAIAIRLMSPKGPVGVNSTPERIEVLQ